MATATGALERTEERMLPSGNVAFLFTDIVGSTVRWERDPEAMRRDLRRHDELLRSAIESHGGYVFKTVGDAFCAAFADIGDALKAAVDGQRAFIAETFSSQDGLAVRMAVHIGESDERDGDYFGPTLNRVARLLSIGHGNQVLLSGAAATAARTLTECAGELRDLGDHRLKDLTTPERVFQLVAPDLPADFPALRSLSVLSNNLPQQTTSFIGREEEVEAIRGLLAGSRLVTLAGTGGVGKTRCALQVAAEMLDTRGDGVWFVDLAPLQDASLVAATIARIFDLQEMPNEPVLQTLCGHLKGKQLLLILDNCEHVLDEASKCAAALLRECPGVAVLATSREALNVAGEALYRMPVMPVRAAVALFEERGRRANPKLALTGENASVAAEICRRLDGIPLAIELAAARLRVLAPKQLAEKLNERFRILTGGDRAALPRQQTMRALIDWSYELLSERDRALFQRTAVFYGGFTIETATGICAAEALDELDVLDGLTSLVDKSLLLAEPQDDESVRYRLLESTHEYAREKLAESGELDAVTARHALAYAAVAEQLHAKYEELAPEAWLAQAQVEIENVRAALTWSFSPAGEVLIGQRIAAMLPRVFGIVAANEALRWVKVALERVTDETPELIVAGLELAHANLASVFNQFNAALTAADCALPLFASLDRPVEVMEAQRLAGRSLIYLGRVEEGENLLQLSLKSRRAQGSTRVGGVLGDLAVARALQGDLPGARSLFAQAKASFEERADASKLATTAATLAEAEFFAGDVRAALDLAEQALTCARALGRHRIAAAILGNLAAYHLEVNEFGPAKGRAREALQICRDIHPDAVSVAFALQHLATAATLEPPEDLARTAVNRARCAHLLGFVESRLEALDVKREHTERLGHEKLCAALQACFETGELEGMVAAGKSWSEEHAITESALL